MMNRNILKVLIVVIIVLIFSSLSITLYKFNSYNFNKKFNDNNQSLLSHQSFKYA